MGKRKKVVNYRNIILGLFAVFFTLPLIFNITNSFMSTNEVNDRYSESVTANNFFDLRFNEVHFVKPTILPTYSTTEQYSDALIKSRVILRMFWNSILITVTVVIGQVIISSLAAYAFEIWDYKHKEKIFFVYILVMLMPSQVLLVPNFLLFEFLKINNSYFAVIVPKLFNPLGFFLMRQMSRNFRRELVDAGLIDGCTHFRIYRSIYIPLIKPAVLLLAVMTFVDMWNAVEIPIVFIKDMFKQPLSVYISQILNSDNIFAVSVFYMIPAIIVFYTMIKQMKDSDLYSGNNF